ncbi:MAG: DNA primase [Thermodesulfovibrionales bacterium]
MKTEGLLEDIKARLDIVDIISDYIELRRAGQNYRGLCPFHSEKTPSFTVSPDKQIFHCFGCGVGGNIVNFVMRYENLSFSESLRLLAKKAGIDLRGYKLDSDGGLREKLIEIHKEASRLFAEGLRRSKSASTYLRDRGIKEETIKVFSLGYAMRDWHCLYNYLKGRGFSDPLILQSGLASSGERGMYDAFRDRIMFPICDIQGNVIAFGGRVMDDSQPKYLNSPDTPLFKKGETVYGLNLAKEGIRKSGYAIITEGYFDVIACHQYGFNNAIAPLGTALTAGHLRKLRRFTKKVVLVFDGDDAGKAAAKKSIPILFEQGFSASVLLLLEKDDPDSLLRRKGSDSFADMLSKAESPVEFILRTSKKDKVETVHEALEVISAAGDMIMKEDLIRELSEGAGIRETVLRGEMKMLGRRIKTAVPASLRGERGENKVPPTRYDEEVLLLSAAIACPDRLDNVMRMVPLGEFKNVIVRKLFEKLSAAGGRVDSILTALNDEEKMTITRLTLNPGFDLENVDRNVEDCIRRIALRKLDERLKEAKLNGDLRLLNSLLLERQRLVKAKGTGTSRL